ncbi:hypothetical protein ANCDUO_01657 [Ancylostoma duodenale]|uniref:Uncharacterized protein n=1 Tax=Ancylostoma duodenale TaxID=51022 RepID=A0A0C2HEP3_9BILA|nr:hypothetical protein ANCDUO_01657 [Ancylostoma duodenale]
MLRWASGVTRLDHVRNEECYAPHVLRATKQSVEKIAHEFEVPGKRPRGRPTQCWADTLHKDLKIVGLHLDQAHDRSKWLQSRRADPATTRDKRRRREDDRIFGVKRASLQKKGRRRELDTDTPI